MRIIIIVQNAELVFIGVPVFARLCAVSKFCLLDSILSSELRISFKIFNFTSGCLKQNS